MIHLKEINVNRDCRRLTGYQNSVGDFWLDGTDSDLDSFFSGFRALEISEHKQCGLINFHALNHSIVSFEMHFLILTKNEA